MIALDGSRFTRCHKTAVFDDRNFIAELFRHLQHMRGEENCRARIAKFPHHALKRMRSLRVKAYKGFIQNQQLRRMHKRRNERRFLLHAVGIRADQPTQAFLHLKCRGIACDTLLPLSLRNAEHVRNEIDVLHARQIIVQLRIVRDVGCNCFAGHRLFLHRHAADADFPFLKAQCADCRADRGRLSRAVVADKTVNVPRINAEGKPVYCPFPTGIGFGKVLKCKHMPSFGRRCGTLYFALFIIMQMMHLGKMFFENRRCILVWFMVIYFIKLL